MSLCGYLSFNLVYRLGGGIDIYEKKIFANESEFEVRKNGHLIGSYSTLEKALDSQKY